jgi:hypothetical protein
MKNIWLPNNIVRSKCPTRINLIFQNKLRGKSQLLYERIKDINDYISNTELQAGVLRFQVKCTSCINPCNKPSQTHRLLGAST